MAWSFYIYYRVEPAKAGQCEPRVRELFKLVQKVTGVQGRLMTKRGEGNLWMEVYENVRDPDRLEATLADLLAEHRFSACLAPGSERRMERFVAPA